MMLSVPFQRHGAMICGMREHDDEVPEHSIRFLAAAIRVAANARERRLAKILLGSRLEREIKQARRDRHLAAMRRAEKILTEAEHSAVEHRREVMKRARVESVGVKPDEPLRSRHV